MTPEQLAEVKAQLTAIPLGDGWCATAWDGGYCQIYTQVGDDLVAIADVWQSDGADGIVDFITAAPERIATLVSEVEKLRKVVDFYDGKYDGQAWAKVAGLTNESRHGD